MDDFSKDQNTLRLDDQQRVMLPAAVRRNYGLSTEAPDVFITWDPRGRLAAGRDPGALAGHAEALFEMQRGAADEMSLQEIMDQLDIAKISARMDRRGRLSLPGHLLAKAGITETVRLVQGSRGILFFCSPAEIEASYRKGEQRFGANLRARIHRQRI